MANYNITFLNESTSATQVFEGVNNMTGGLYASLMLLGFFIIVFIAMKKYDTDVALLSTSFVVSTIAMLFLVMGWISIEIFAIPITILIISVFYKVASG